MLQSDGFFGWVLHWPPSVGICIALLAVAAMLMTTRPQPMSRREKYCWILLAFILLLGELYAMQSKAADDARQFAQSRHEEDDRFAKILAQNQEQFAATMQRTSDVFNATKDVAGLAKQSLETISGGSSYAYVMPQNEQRNGHVSMYVENAGNQLLSGVTATLSKFLSGGEDCGIPPKKGCVAQVDLGPMEYVSIGNLPPHSKLEFPKFLELDDQAGHFLVELTAQNGVVQEEILLRKATGGIGSAFKLQIRTRGPHSRIVRTVDWTEPKPE